MRQQHSIIILSAQPKLSAMAAAAAYYDQSDIEAKLRFQPQGEGAHLEGRAQDLRQGIHSELRVYPQQQGYPQLGYNGQNGGSYSGQQQGISQQQFDNGTYSPADPQEQGLLPDKSDILTKCNDSPSGRVDDIQPVILSLMLDVSVVKPVSGSCCY
ncbi:hypothetical protein N7G274_001414 [Stereocaulon virgatum]|uniref:Uncharacterized protein n=1 Tax=Stereocaulon virgatum TaxID=373712 RepID=A0ABR4AV86_9LECA